MKKGSFIMYVDNRQQFEMISDEQAGKLIKALLSYADTGEKMQTEDGMLQMAFSFLSGVMDRDAKKYNETCERRAENAKKRWEQKQKEQETKAQDEKPKEDKPEEAKQSVEIAEVISYLNKKAGTNYRTTTSSTVRHISARVKEGYSVDDFKKVIDSKCRQWLKDDTMKKYLRPETLFGQKFESYLQDANSRNRGEGNDGAAIAGINGTVI